MPSYNALASELAATNAALAALTMRVTNDEIALKVLADRLGLDETIIASLLPPLVLPASVLSDIQFQADFTQPYSNYGFTLQARDPSRASYGTWLGRSGIKLTTLQGDNNILNSGTMERCDLAWTQADTDGYEGHEAWWAHSIFFPDDFAMPLWHGYVVFDFHHTGPTGQANFHILNVRDPAGDSLPGIMTFRGFGGQTVDSGAYEVPIGPWVKNSWYDFVYHVRWSSTANGYLDAWVNGARKLSHQGPTLYAGLNCYLKLANYHNPICDPYPACIGTHGPSSVVHGKLVRASTLAGLGLKADATWQTLSPL